MTTISSREFNRDVSAAKRAALEGPVVITDEFGNDAIVARKRGFLSLGYDRWAGIFSQQWMKVLTFGFAGTASTGSGSRPTSTQRSTTAPRAGSGCCRRTP